jgi:hypothetical protein
MANPNAPRGAAVRNAADPRQVRFAERLEGRVVMATLIRRAGVYKSIWHPSSEIHYNAGRQDYGHELMADLVRLSGEETYQLMEREEWAWTKHQQATIDAAHTARSDGGQTDER